VTRAHRDHRDRGGFDARDVRAGRLDDVTVAQAVEGRQ